MLSRSVHPWASSPRWQALLCQPKTPPRCEPSRPTDCVLPDWSDAAEGDIPSLFGPIDGLVWVIDGEGDAPSSGLDILALGVGDVEIEDAAAIRDSDDLLKLGALKKAVKAGPARLVRIVLDRPADEIAEGHAGVHVATDIDGSPSNNAPSGVGSADNPFAGSQDIYSLTYASTTGKTKLLSSDLAKAWYKDRSPYAAAWAAPNVLDMLIAPEDVGPGIRAISFVSGDEGGYDSVSVGTTAVPVNGRVGLVPVCIEGSVSTESFTVRRLVENGQTLRDVDAPASWRGGATLPISASERSALEMVIATADEDGDGQALLASTVSLFEDGVVIRQRPDIGLKLEGDTATLWLELGLTRRGYNALRDIDVAPTGDGMADAWLERATNALSQSMPPFRVTKKAGLVAGEGVGACLPVSIHMPAEGPSSLPADEPTSGHSTLEQRASQP